MKKKIAAATGTALLVLTLNAGPASATHDGYPLPNYGICKWLPFLCGGR